MGAAAIAGSSIPGAQQAIAYAVFSLIGTLRMGTPWSCTSPSAPDRKTAGRPEGLDERHNAVIMIVLCLVIGAKLIGDGISGPAG